MLLRGVRLPPPALQVQSVIDGLLPITYSAEESIIREGTHGDTMYFIAKGTVQLSLKPGGHRCVGLAGRRVAE